jgi:hypothetical protein
LTFNAQGLRVIVVVVQVGVVQVGVLEAFMKKEKHDEI